MSNSALDLLQNLTYAIDLSLHRKLSKEVSLTRDVRLCDDGVYGGATAAVAGGVHEDPAFLAPTKPHPADEYPLPDNSVMESAPAG